MPVKNTKQNIVTDLRALNWGCIFMNINTNQKYLVLTIIFHICFITITPVSSVMYSVTIKTIVFKY